MIKKNKGLVFGLFAFLLTIVGGFVLSGCSTDKGDNIAYINNVADFNLKFQTEKVVYVDDLDFEEDNVWNVNRSIKFVGKKDKSTIKNVFINITAPKDPGRRIKVEFENIVFDGGFETEADLTQNGSFESILGSDRNDKRCITAHIGQYDLSIDNCEFTNYSSKTGSVLYVDNDTDKISLESKVISINNSKFYDNICKKGTVCVGNGKTSTKITNCEFYENHSAIGAGFNVSNGQLFVDNCVIRDNEFCRFAISDVSGQDAGGGVHIGAAYGKMCNTKILNNNAIFGGGLSVGTAQAGDENFVIENCEIKGNTASSHGGGVMINSKLGQTISFIGCEISFNTAPSSASVCSIPLASYRGNQAGNLNFFFCKIAMNKGMDNKSMETDLEFYVNAFATPRPPAKESQKANLQVKGCIIIDDTTLIQKDGDFNYIASQTQAEIDGVIDSAQIANSLDKNLCLLENEKTNIVVPASVYSKWNMEFVNATKGVKIGSFALPETERTTNLTLIISLTIATILVLSASAVLVIMQNKRKVSQIADKTNKIKECAKNKEQQSSNSNEKIATNNQENNCSANVVENEEVKPSEQDKLHNIEKVCAMLVKQKVLSKREAGIVELIMQDKKANDIHEILFISKNTIKYHMKNIYAKLSVKNREELRARIEAELQKIN